MEHPKYLLKLEKPQKNLKGTNKGSIQFETLFGSLENH